jgi:cytochrome c oxidase cbb3-type subunit 3
MTDNNPFPGENNTGHIWDDNLRELKNPPPRWWMLAFWASLVWWIGYGILYPMWPGLTGYTKGVLGWTQIREYHAAVAEVDAVRAPFEEKIRAMTVKEILADDGLSAYVEASAKVSFGDNCAACHGAGGQGNPGYPVLADDDWLYGGAIETIEQTVLMGRKGIMTGHGKVLAKDEIDQLANYAVALSEGKEDPDGHKLFMEKGCIACHGIDAKGLQMLGSANLTDAVWRFEPGGFESARYTIMHGVNDITSPQSREAVMPKFGGTKLSNDDIKKLAVYVHKLGGGQ